jgi:coenzyme F420-reducing hydrogenase delta subunit
MEGNYMTENTANKEWEPKIAAIVCNWCTYAGADLAGISRIQYPPNVRIIRVPCTGRINPFYIVKALQEGADGVLVSGCHPGECHYLSGNLVARRKFAALKSFLTYIGVEGNRTIFTWVSASEGDRFAQVIRGVTAKVKALGPASKLVKKVQEQRG